MYHCFTAKPDLTPYRYLRPQVDLEERNKPGAWGADLSERFGFAKEDAADDILLNEVIRRSVKGAQSLMPAPVHAAFVFHHLDD